MRRSIAFLIMAASILFFCTTVPAYGNGMKITKDKAIEIASIEAKKVGYDIGIMNIKTTKYDTPWNEYLPKESNEEYYVAKKNKLKNREYWAVYYYPNRDKVGIGYKGGDFCIFVDVHTGEIITDMRWK